jgi:hypothetical protein
MVMGFFIVFLLAGLIPPTRVETILGDGHFEIAQKADDPNEKFPSLPTEEMRRAERHSQEARDIGGAKYRVTWEVYEGDIVYRSAAITMAPKGGAFVVKDRASRSPQSGLEDLAGTRRGLNGRETT